MIGQPSTMLASKDAGRRARPADHRLGIDPSSAAWAWGVLPTHSTLSSTNRQEQLSMTS
jgi:hypothetical protein